MIRVWAVGDLGGGIAADRNVGDFTSPFHPVCGIYSTDYTLFSYGDMSPTVRATNTASLPTGGHVGCVGALGDITGDFEAVAELVGFRAGGDITATITAPVVGPILANDSTMASDFPVPATPASVIAEILAEAAALYAELVDAKTTTAAEIASLLANFATEKAAALTKLADDVAAVVQSNAVIPGLASQKNADQQQAEAEQRESLRAQIQAAFEEFATFVENEMNQIIERRDEVIANHDEYFSQLDTEEAEIIEILAEDDEHMEEVRDSAVEAAGEMREMRDELWNDFVEMLAKHAEAGWYHPPVPPPAETDDAGVLTAFSSRKWLDDFDTPENIREWEELQTGAVESFKTLVSSAPVIGFTFSFLEAVGGTDVFTGRKLTPSARAWAWLTVLSTVVGGGVASRSASNVAGNAKNLGPLLSLQRQLATLVNRQGQVVTKLLSSSNSELG